MRNLLLTAFIALSCTIGGQANADTCEQALASADAVQEMANECVGADGGGNEMQCLSLQVEANGEYERAWEVCFPTLN
jgi:hypothetical protein